MDGWITIGTKIDTATLDEQLDDILIRINELEQEAQDISIGAKEGDLQEIYNEASQLNEKAKEITKELIKQNLELLASSKGVKKIGEGLTKTIKGFAKTALALFGIQMGIRAIKSAISAVSQYNDDVANKMEQMKYNLVMAIEPIVIRIVNWIYRLLQYVQYLVKIWTGKDIFAGAAKNMSKTAKSANDVKKSLAGFDTANVLSSSSSSSGGGGVSSLGSMEALPEADIPKWLLWVKENGFEVATIISGIAAAIVLVKLGLTGLEALTIVAIIVQIVLVLKAVYDQIGNIIRWLKDPSWENFKKVIEGFIGTFGILGVIFNAVIAILKNKFPEAFSTIEKGAQKIYEKFQVVFNGISTVFKTLVSIFSSIFGTIFNNIKVVLSNIAQVFVLLFNKIKTIFSPLVSFFSSIWNKIKSLFTKMGSSVGNSFKSAFVSVINAVLKAAESVLNVPIKGINKLIKEINKLPNVNMTKLSEFSLPRLATGGIVNNPGRGVPIGSAIAGERGREGVLPLTDSQAMAQLGQEIGKWISVNVDLTTKLDSRVLSRSLERVKDTNSFIRNGV